MKDEIMGAVADDYESLEIILSTITTHGAPVEEEDLIRDLEELVKQGLVDPYELSPHPPHAAKVPFDPSRVRELWFYLSPQGLAAYKARS